MPRKQQSVTKRGGPSPAKPAGRLWLLKWLILLALMVLLLLWLLYPQTGSAGETLPTPPISRASTTDSATSAPGSTAKGRHVARWSRDR